ncbi:Nramp family divalent metal transporter [Flexithrix dorotheae]|uniref:Nramp family divalent metal transporter n=1 Tax=Flexithrix dorotheae TaxID=70993 RepID=UPI00036E07CF|nr:Nramp family divalent metal transporter [Flexithrix dorotheae]
MQKNNTIVSIKKRLVSVGPGIITAALVFGPGSLTITSKMGAMYGFNMIWVVALSVFFMMSYTEMGARIGMVSKNSLLGEIRGRWGKGTAIIIGLGIFLITSSFQAGNTIGAGLAFAELTETSTIPWVIGFTALGISLLFFKSFYKVLERIMLAMVGLMLASFFITLVLAQPNLADVLQGFVPTLPKGAEILTIALIASSFSIVGVFYQAYLVKEKGWKKEELKQGKRESLTGIFILGLISAFIMINAAAVLHPKGVEVKSALDMGLALEPLFGKITALIFMLGLFGASFSSLVGNATIGGALFADAFSLGNRLDNKNVKLLIMLVMVVGAVIALSFGKLPLELIIFAQAITIVLAPMIAVALLLIANDQNIMGEQKNNITQNITCSLGLLLLLFLAGNHIYFLFIK